MKSKVTSIKFSDLFEFNLTFRFTPDKLKTNRNFIVIIKLSNNTLEHLNLFL